MRSRYSDKKVFEIINDFGLKAKPQYICVNPNYGYKGSHRLVSIQHMETKEIKNGVFFSVLIKSRNPFYLGKSKDFFIEKEINKLGEKSNPQYICVNPNYGYKRSHRLVSIQHIETKEIKNDIYLTSLTDGSNPWKTTRIDDGIIEKEINKLGEKSNPQYICVDSYYGKSKSGTRLVSLQNIKTKKIKRGIQFNGLRYGQNPFNECQNRIEITKVQPKYEKLLKKLKINYVKEFRLGSKRIDFMLSINGKRYGLEVKRSDKNHIGKNQLETYRKIGNLKQYKLSKVLLSDPCGKHKNSLSIKDLEKTLKNLIQK